MNRRAITAVLAATTLAAAGCSLVDDATARPSPTPTATDRPQSTPSPSVVDVDLAVVWAGTFDVPLPNGWSVQDCEGDRLDACVHAGDAVLGDVELLNGYPLDEAQLRQDADTVLTGLAVGFLDHFREDRSVGCSDFEFVADDVRDATVGGQSGKRAAFSLVDRGGRVVERVVNHFALQGGTYVIANADAYVAEGGCLGPSETDASFTPDDLAAIEASLDELVADSPLPAAP